ncbi:MAG: DNA polymerase III subunit delta [Clostridium sp.]
MLIKALNNLLQQVNTNKLGNFVVMHGNDKEKILKCEATIKGIVKNLVELNFIEIEGNNITFDIIENACETVPVMEEIKVVHVKSPCFIRDNLDSPAKATLKEIIDYAKNIPKYTILLISHKDIIEKSNQILKTAVNIGTLVEIKIPLYGKELTSWVEMYIKEKGKTINKSDAYYLSNEMSTSTDNIEMELEKLVCYIGESQTITKKDIDDIIYKTPDSNIFKMSEYMYKRDARGAIEILDTIFLQGEQYPRIMFMITRQFRILYSVKLLIDEGKESSYIISTLKLHDFVYKGILKIISSWESKEIKLVLEDALDTDYNIKNGKISPELGLELLILRTCK